MALSKRSPAGKAGLQRDQVGAASQVSNTETGLQAQLLASRHGLDPARARLVASLAYGGRDG